jgi:glycosyltransferase involved in cell wall biosynthesis
MIGTPSYDGRIDVWYTNSLCDTIKASYNHNVEIIPTWVSFDALIQRARNDTLAIAIQSDVDDLIFIDSDIEWKPEWIFKLLNYDVDVVGGTYPKKSAQELYVVRKLNNDYKFDPKAELMEVDGLGTGFVRLSRTALRYLWDTSPVYHDPKDNKERRMICDVVIKDMDLISEDINMFMKLQEGGFKIYLDPRMTCNHVGAKKFTGDFLSWYTSLAPQPLQVPKKQL